MPLGTLRLLADPDNPTGPVPVGGKVWQLAPNGFRLIEMNFEMARFRNPVFAKTGFWLQNHVTTLLTPRPAKSIWC
jgi:hypothetical protein